MTEQKTKSFLSLFEILTIFSSWLLSDDRRWPTKLVELQVDHRSWTTVDEVPDQRVLILPFPCMSPSSLPSRIFSKDSPMPTMSTLSSFSRRFSAYRLSTGYTEIYLHDLHKEIKHNIHTSNHAQWHNIFLTKETLMWNKNPDVLSFKAIIHYNSLTGFFHLPHRLTISSYIAT